MRKRIAWPALVIVFVAILALSACDPDGDSQPTNTSSTSQDATASNIPAAYVTALRAASIMEKPDGSRTVVEPSILASIVLTGNIRSDHKYIWPSDPSTYSNSNGATGAFWLLPQYCSPKVSVHFALAAKCAAKYLSSSGYSGMLPLGNPARPAPRTVAGALAAFYAGAGYVTELQNNSTKPVMPAIAEYVHTGMAYFREITDANIFENSLDNEPAFVPPVVRQAAAIPPSIRGALLKVAKDNHQSARVLGSIVLVENVSWPKSAPNALSHEQQGAAGSPQKPAGNNFGLMPSACLAKKEANFAVAADCAAKFLTKSGFTADMPPGNYLFPTAGTIAGAFAVYNGGPRALTPYGHFEENRAYASRGLAYYKQLCAPNILGNS